MKHINDVWEFLDQFTSIEDLEDAFGEIPSKFGFFDIINKETAKEEGCAEICNSYWDDAMGDYEYDYHCVDLD